MRSGHREFVESWLRRRAGTSSAPQLAGDALAAVWERAQRSLSDGPLQALARCALDAAAKEFPVLADLRVGARGFELGACAEAPPNELLAGLGGLLVEFLCLMEETSGAILAPALEAELLRVARTPPQGLRPVAPG